VNRREWLSLIFQADSPAEKWHRAVVLPSVAGVSSGSVPRPSAAVQQLPLDEPPECSARTP